MRDNLIITQTMLPWDCQADLHPCLPPTWSSSQSSSQIKTSHQTLEGKLTSVALWQLLPHQLSREMPALLFIWLTAGLWVRSRQRQSKHCLTDRQPPKAWGTHTHANTQGFPTKEETSHSQLLPDHSALTNTPNSLEMLRVKCSPGPAHQRSCLMIIRMESGMDSSFHLMALF